MSHRSISPLLGLSLVALLAAGCKKKEEPPAVIEEAPAAAAPVETDTSATLAEEPSLQQVGANGSRKPGSPSPSAEAAGFSERGSIVVQVSVFKSARQAANLVEKLAAQGYPAYVAEVESPTPEMPGTYHRVRIGRFQRIADAKAFGENTLRPAGYDFWVDNKKNDAVGSGGYSGGDSYSAPSTPAESAPEPSSFSAEPSAPSGDAWSAPKAEESSSAPSGSSADAWGSPKADASTPSSSPSTDSPTPAAPDTGKVNLDEW